MGQILVSIIDMQCLSVYLTSSVYIVTEGPWTQVSQAIHDCHAAVHASGAPRVATDIRIGTRIDRHILPGEGNEGKVKRVEEILAKDHDRPNQH